MTQTPLLRAAAPSRRPVVPVAGPTTYGHGRRVRRRRGPGVLGLVLSAVLAGWLATHTEVLDVSRLLGDPPLAAGDGAVSVVVLDGSGAELTAAGADDTHWTASLA